jgi:2-polyprenyl-3-methyl-5-hydroxy-6-metoxy-1,4-benzoquinol methylase
VEAVGTPAFKIISCKHCTNAFTAPAPGAIPYEAMDFHAGTVQDGGSEQLKSLADLPYEWKFSIERQVSILRKAVPAGGRILEVGCGEGLLAGELVRAGYDVTGIEPSPSASGRAARRGVKVFTGYFPHPQAGGPYHAVVMSHVLEHIEDPLRTLQQLNAALAPGGLLLLIQTNYRGILPRKWKENWYAWVPDQHFWHFTPKGLTYLARQCGFKAVQNEYSSLVHGSHPYETYTRYLPFLRDQFHLLLQKNGA